MASRPTATAEEVERIFREHGAFVWRALRRMGIPESDADDLCQEVFVIAHRKLPEFEERSSITTWLYGILAKVALAHKRRAHVKREIVTDAPPEGTAPLGPDDALAESEARALLDRALDTLDDDKRLVFVLFEIESLPMADVARIAECPLQTAYSRLHAAREQVEAQIRRIARKGGAP